MGKTLLLLSGSEIGIAQQLHDKGHTLAVMDGSPEAPAFAIAASCLIADVWQPSDCAASAERYNRKIRKLDAVLLGADAPMTAAAVSTRLHLPGLPLHVAELANNRLASKRAFLSAGVPTPWHAEIATAQELQRVIIARGRDLVLKPLERLEPSTVLRLEAVEDPVAAYQKIRAAAPDGRVMVEAIKGAVRLPAFLLAGTCYMAAKQDVRTLIERAASALGISDGPLVADVMQQDGVLQLVELLPRLSAIGDFLDAAIAWASGENVSPEDLAAQ